MFHVHVYCEQGHQQKMLIDVYGVLETYPACEMCLRIEKMMREEAAHMSRFKKWREVRRARKLLKNL